LVGILLHNCCVLPYIGERERNCYVTTCAGRKRKEIEFADQPPTDGGGGGGGGGDGGGIRGGDYCNVYRGAAERFSVSLRKRKTCINT